MKHLNAGQTGDRPRVLERRDPCGGTKDGNNSRAPTTGFPLAIPYASLIKRGEIKMKLQVEMTDRKLKSYYKPCNDEQPPFYGKIFLFEPSCCL